MEVEVLIGGRSGVRDETLGNLIMVSNYLYSFVTHLIMIVSDGVVGVVDQLAGACRSVSKTYVIKI
jgi:hypothetical protein